MKVLMRCQFLAIFCLPFLAPSVSCAAEVLNNPDFEAGSTDWPGLSGIETNNGNVYAGSNSARINQSFYWRQASQTFPCVAGELLSFGGYVKVSAIDQGSAGIRVSYYDASDTKIGSDSAGSISGTQGYTLVSNDAVAPVNTTYAKMELFVGKSTNGLYGLAYFDDLFVDTFSHKSFLIFDSDFDSGLDGWSHKAQAHHVDYNGGKALRFTHAGHWKSSYHEFPCVVGQEYAVSFGIATDGSTSGSGVRIRFYDSSNSQLSDEYLAGNSAGTSAYTLYSMDGIFPPANAVKMRFMGYSGTGGSGGFSYLDDVTISTEQAGGLPSPNLIPQQLTEVMPDPGFENGVGDWTSGLSVETTNVAVGSQSARIPAFHFFKAYNHDLIAAGAGEYYSMSIKLAFTNITDSPGIVLQFIASDGTTVLGSSGGLFDAEGTFGYRDYRVDNARTPAGTAYIRPRISMPANDEPGSDAFIDEVHVYKVTTLPVRAVPTYESISVYVGRESQSTDEVAHVYYREAGTSTWFEALEPIFDSVVGEYRGSIIGLNEDTDYEIQVVLEANGTVLEEAGTTVSTWTSTPNHGAVQNFSSYVSGGKAVIEDVHGTPDSWVKIVGTGSNDLDAGYANDVAVTIENCSYVILENVDIKGGRRHSVKIEHSDSIRLINCEMSGWARQPNYTDGTYFYENAGDVGNSNKRINKDAAVYMVLTSAVTIERCYMHDPRLGANNWGPSNNKHPLGPNAIYVQNILGTANYKLMGNSVVRYNDMIGSDGLRWNDAIEGENNSSDGGSFYRDSDVYGNMITFANDDSTELDGGQKNVRFFGNRVENCFVGLSLAPCRLGPSYVYRNIITNMGDDRGISYNMVKLGGGPTHSKGKSFFFNNTFYAIGNGLGGVGFGSDSGDSRRMFKLQSRNNIIYSLQSFRNTINDVYPDVDGWSSFDYDNLASAGASVAKVNYAAGNETNGILNNYPTFVNAAVGDFRPAGGSSAIDSGLPMFNFADIWNAVGPDQGALEDGDSSLIPIRPINMTSDKYLLTLSGSAGGANQTTTFKLTSGSLGGSWSYEILKNDSEDWLTVTSSGSSIGSNSTKTFTVTLLNSSKPIGTYKATILVKFANGHSVPVSIEGTVN
ncbi:hypothetical protein [Rubellicoccus peritrichatus]|uniref:Right handed beta helix domain-containing protein n=1 Tax=Rubellicoccus peritrichatus TaxID=3080537 RepID=A0AAQ3LJ25_9BACT|nr:hypothetical protein [Puniceicoccus sp. CR14]WOO43069.1 hypothetical protein RZN69_08180 [Puniceicoccus sp. CR14]